VTRLLQQHWREYASEAAALGLFMVSATAFATLFQHPASPLTMWLPQTPVGRLPMGFAMGATAIGLMHSAFGRCSGAHMNPAVTLTFLRLGRIGAADAVAYVVAQCVGALAGSAVALVLLAGLPADRSINFIATFPGDAGVATAFVAEQAMSFGLMLTVLILSNHRRTAPYAGVAAGVLIALYIVVEAPVSGMSLNPARTLGPAILSGRFDAFWIYCTAPVLGMLSAAELFTGICHCRQTATLSETHA
jgi:aquaporin Z